ncbi:hypothetical protein ACHQM5_030235 [Ranunculus cassubicifolius]
MILQALLYSVSCFYFLLFANAANANNQRVSDFHVGVVLDMDSVIGKVGWECIQLALSDFYAAHPDYRTRLFLHPRDSQGDNVKASLEVLDLLQDVEVQAIIGPQTSTQAGLTVNFGNKAHVPMLSFSATSSSLSFHTPYFVQVTHNDSSQLKATTAIIQSFQWREVVTIYENSEYGNGMIPFIIDVLQDEQVKIPYKSVISPLATDDQIRVELYKLMNLHSRVFIVHMSRILGYRFFALAKEVGMMTEGYVWIITDGLMNVNGSLDASTVSLMQGVLGVKPYIERSRELDNFTDRWRKMFHQDLNIYGLWAYDAVWILAMAAESVGVAESQSDKPREGNNPTTIKGSEKGPDLLEVILKTRFKGLSGDIYFVNGQLQVDTFEIFNVIGKEARGVGFWTPNYGISKELNSTVDQMHMASTNLKGIIWPGDSVIVPKGWMIPAKGKKLKIGVPMKGGFDEFVKVDRDISTNQTTVSGYSIDVFKLIMEALPYPVAYEFEPFMNPDGSSAGSHYELIYQVHQKKYDAVVGDTTITANRSLCVDFSLPFAEGGVMMMVAIEYDDRKSAWIFLKPLTKDLWITSGAFFILTGFVVWVLEHRVNEDFRGPPSQHVGMILWFPLSTIVFAHRERLVSNLTRLVVIVWTFVVLILSSSYTASLSSILTVGKLQPTITSVEQLVKNGDYVGYQKGSFIPDLLMHMHFDETKLKPFSSHEDMDEALRKGSAKGGIAAFFDVAPYIKIFIAKYCNRYTMVGISKSEGFGIAFPRGSPLVADVSRAILKIQESSKMKELDQALFRIQTICSDPKNNDNSNSLDLNSFRGLFFITGTVSGFALLVFLVIFIYKNKHVLDAAESDKAIWTKVKTMLKQFDGKDFSSCRFKKGDFGRDRSMGVRDIEASRSVSLVRDTEAPIVRTLVFTDANHSPSEEIVSADAIDIMPDSVVLEEMDRVRLLC